MLKIILIVAVSLTIFYNTTDTILSNGKLINYIHRENTLDTLVACISQGNDDCEDRVAKY